MGSDTEQLQPSKFQTVRLWTAKEGEDQAERRRTVSVSIHGDVNTSNNGNEGAIGLEAVAGFGLCLLRR